MNPKSRKSNFTNEDFNPCIEELNLTNKCLEKNSYNHNECFYYFENYKICKKFWTDVAAARRRGGIKPFMPTKEEREKIMQERKKDNKVISVPSVS